MTDDWMLDVLSDLRAFAGKNGLDATERQLDQTLVVVAEELASVRGLVRGAVQQGYARELYRPAAEN